MPLEGEVARMIVWRCYRIAVVLSCTVAVLDPWRLGAQQRADTAVVSRIKREALEHSQVMDVAFQLSDVRGPRLTGSPGYKAAGQWALGWLREKGVSNVHAYPFPWDRGWSAQRFSLELVEPQYAPLLGTPVPWSLGTRGPHEAEVVLAPLPSFWDSAGVYDRFIIAQRGKLRGKVVLANAPEPREAALRVWSLGDTLTEAKYEQSEAKLKEKPDRLPASSDVESERYVAGLALQDRLFRFLREEGVVALLYQGWGNVGTVFEGVDGMRTQPAWLARRRFELPPASVTVAAEHYLRLARLVERKIPVRVRIGLESTIHSDTASAFNLIAEIPGGKRADEVVLIGAHFDSWTGGTGATDNAAGSAVMMEAMRVLARLGLKPDRTIRLALWGGHEGPGMGKRTYVREHYVGGLPPWFYDERAADQRKATRLPEFDKLVGYFNLDYGAGRIRGLMLMGDERLRPIFASWLSPLADLGAAHTSLGSAGGTDHVMFHQWGMTGVPFLQDPFPFVSHTHHSNQDLFDNLRADDLRRSAAVVAAVAYQAAMSSERLPRPTPVYP